MPPVRCACGLERPQWPSAIIKHDRSWWHTRHVEIRRLVARGYSATAIARLHGVTRALAARYIKLAEVKR